MKKPKTVKRLKLASCMKAGLKPKKQPKPMGMSGGLR